MEKVIDMAIVGAGPAGMTAAIYGQRAGLSVVILEKNTMGGGQMTYTDKIENYTGIEVVDGFELSMKMQNQVKKSLFLVMFWMMLWEGVQKKLLDK